MLTDPESGQALYAQQTDEGRNNEDQAHYFATVADMRKFVADLPDKLYASTDAGDFKEIPKSKASLQIRNMFKGNVAPQHEEYKLNNLPGFLQSIRQSVKVGDMVGGWKVLRVYPDGSYTAQHETATRHSAGRLIPVRKTFHPDKSAATAPIVNKKPAQLREVDVVEADRLSRTLTGTDDRNEYARRALDAKGQFGDHAHTFVSQDASGQVQGAMTLIDRSEDEQAPGVIIDYLGSQGGGVGTDLVRQAVQYALDHNLTLYAEPTQDSIDFWRDKIKMVEDPDDMGTPLLGWTVDQMRNGRFAPETSISAPAKPASAGRIRSLPPEDQFSGAHSETHRGERLSVRRHPNKNGYLQSSINGHVIGTPIGRTNKDAVRELDSLKSTVDSAHERPEAYSNDDGPMYGMKIKTHPKIAPTNATTPSSPSRRHALLPVGDAPGSLTELTRELYREGVNSNLYQDSAGNIVISKIESHTKNAGNGTKAMQKIIDYADKHGITLVLTPDGSFGGNIKRLESFYRRFGFVPNKGRTRDFLTRESMIRPAKAN